jgi:hypothetical protein
VTGVERLAADPADARSAVRVRELLLDATIDGEPIDREDSMTDEELGDADWGSAAAEGDSLAESEEIANVEELD